ncbi:MAG: DUF5110 domain-containing protein [Bacteroidales bacterium]|nr:DUF5110 domain-containing protein [Bacteroidales bacterium]
MIFLTALLAGAALSANPVARPEAVVPSSHARFTVLTPRLIRMEWASDQVFEDRATLAVVNRNLPVPSFTSIRSGDVLSIRTDSLLLEYRGDSVFNANNLSVRFFLEGKEVIWHPGMDDSGNLMGTARTLDRCDGTPEHPARDFGKGLISRDGWAIVDESNRHVFVEDDSDWKQWVSPRDTSALRKDLYIFAYGHDYKQAIKDYILIGGKIPMPPRWAFGYWWSRYWQYSDYEFLDLARTIRGLGIPADVMIIDMDWHERYTLRKGGAPRDAAGQKVGWTGYTWQKQLFPSPGDFLQDLHGLGYKTALNLHPASGITPLEDCYDTFVKDYLSRTSDYDGPPGYINPDGSKAQVFFRASQREWTDAWFNSVLHPLEDQGVDFWWMDWQQWKTSKYMEGLNITFWLNHLFFNDKVRRSVSEGIHAPRPMIYHRWGGLGSHRYQVGFSGDVYEEWTALQFIPYFTATASNVGFGYWGHDIGGLRQWVPHFTNSELYTRWFQSAVFTPIFKTHWNKSEVSEKRMWMHPGYFPYMKEAVRLRYDLFPYIYNAARKAWETGICICRPMYYEDPGEELAYSMKEQYYFGDDIIASTICEGADPVTGLSKRTVWFPPGSDWYDVSSGAVRHGGSLDTLSFTIAENPWFIRAGAIIPMSDPGITSLQEPSDVLRLFIAPGDGETTIDYYEDDGISQAYPEEWALTRITKVSDASGVKVKVGGRKGSFKGMSRRRTLSLTFEGVLPPESVTVNGRRAEYSRHPRKDSRKPWWTYDGYNLAWTLHLPKTRCRKTVKVEARYPEESAAAREQVFGKKGIIKRIRDITPETKLVYCKWDDAFQAQPVPYLKVAQCGSFITEFPEKALEYLRGMDIDAMLESVCSNPALPDGFKQKLSAWSRKF